MNCREFVDFLMAYLDEELPQDQRAVFDSHMSKCPPCRDYLESYRKVVELGRKACCCEDGPPPADVPKDLVAAILSARRAGN